MISGRHSTTPLNSDAFEFTTLSGNPPDEDREPSSSPKEDQEESSAIQSRVMSLPRTPSIEEVNDIRRQPLENSVSRRDVSLGILTSPLSMHKTDFGKVERKRSVNSREVGMPPFGQENRRDLMLVRFEGKGFADIICFYHKI